MIKVNVNNQRTIEITQDQPDGAMTVTAWSVERGGIREVEYEYKIAPADFVSMLNWYRFQKENGNPNLLF